MKVWVIEHWVSMNLAWLPLWQAGPSWSTKPLAEKKLLQIIEHKDLDPKNYRVEPYERVVIKLKGA